MIKQLKINTILILLTPSTTRFPQSWKIWIYEGGHKLLWTIGDLRDKKVEKPLL